MLLINGKKYNVHIGEGLLRDCADIIKSVGINGKIAVIADSNTAPLYSAVLINTLENAGFEVCCFSFPEGERSKNINTLSDILEFLAENEITRSGCIAALGGGVTGDLAGLAAGMYMRGIAWVQLPTTLLAAVDSSVGGKTAVNLRSGKNLAGLFYAPKAVICDTDTLKTLPEGVFADGMAEVVKTAVIGDAELFRAVEAEEYKSDIAEIIRRCVTLKMEITDEDERDYGRRRLLNLGHTCAHAVEKLSGCTVSHGSAVAIGLSVMCRATAINKGISAEDARRVTAVLERCQLPTHTKYTAAELSQAAVLDKKRNGESITLVIPQKIGLCRTEKVSLKELENIFGDGV